MNNRLNQAPAATGDVKDEGITVDRRLCLFGSNARKFMLPIFVKLKPACRSRSGIPRYFPTHDG